MNIIWNHALELRSSTWSAGIIHTHLHKSYFPYGQQTVSSGILWILGSSGCFHLLWTTPILEVSRVVDGLMMAETIEFHKDVKPHHEWLARGPQEACTCYVYLWVAIGKVQGDVLLMFLWIDFEYINNFYFGHSMVFTNHSTFHANLLSTILSFWTPDRSLFFVALLATLQEQKETQQRGMRWTQTTKDHLHQLWNRLKKNERHETCWIRLRAGKNRKKFVLNCCDKWHANHYSFLIFDFWIFLMEASGCQKRLWSLVKSFLEQNCVQSRNSTSWLLRFHWSSMERIK